jgi:hypothetical protein
MLFGEPADFAIEAYVEPDLKPPSAVWGRMCVWCRGVPLGDISERYCALYPAYCSFRSLPSCLDSLWADELAGLGDEGVWNFLDADWAAWDRFNFLSNWGERFDGYKAFIL